MNRLLLPLLLSFAAALGARADLLLARDGKSKCVIVRQPGATPAEAGAIAELADTLRAITGAEFPIVEASNKPPANAIIVGPGPAARAAFPKLDCDALGAEELVIQTRGSRLLLAGGRSRGTLYAVSQFLQAQCGVRWWTPWAARIPKQPTLKVGSLAVRYRPVFEARDPFWYPAFDARWAVHNFSNSQSANIPDDLGGCIRYKGFVHTFFSLVPPAEYFEKHPEWFSFRNGKRVHEGAQLCLANPDLRAFVVQRVKQWLRDAPGVSIVSVSQNDCQGWCECDQCKALDDAEGSHAGSLIAFVNHVAGQVAPEFPNVAVDTLAYQYTRRPPRTLRPRPNVIVRLCSIECDFREPLDAPANATFADDIRGWAGICQRLYIWDYTTDFSHYVQPHPNWFTLGPNVRFFAAHHVKGVFEQGAYQGTGAEFAELRAWVLAQLLWNPAQDDRALINEFLDGYYGAAAPSIRAYLDLLHRNSAGWNLTCYSPPSANFLNFRSLAAAEQLWAEAERLASPEMLPRVKLARLWTRYVWLSQWERLRKECSAAGAQWPLGDSRLAEAEAWLKLAHGDPGLTWTRIALINEPGLTPDQFVARLRPQPR
jgi:hypothetical protein